jgi:hypothetical protein
MTAIIKTERVTITPPNMQVAEFEVVGTSPYVQNAFSVKTREQMAAKHAAGDKGAKNTKKNRAAKDFDACCREATHWLPDGTPGIPASGIRASLISACRLAGFKMTIAKMAVFVLEDGFSSDGIPLVKLHGEYERFDAYVRNETGVPDVRARNMWKQWHLRLRIRYDADQFSLADVSNLLMRAGMQVGWGEGRPDSKRSLAGMGWGTFELRQGDQ